MLCIISNFKSQKKTITVKYKDIIEYEQSI